MSNNTKRKKIAILIDPGKENTAPINEYIKHINKSKPDLILIGGSQNHDELHEYVNTLKANCNTPIYLFPGNASQFTPEADGILLLSLLSGRNPEFLIEQHVRSAIEIAESKIKVIPTAYILINGGQTSAVERLSKTSAIPKQDLEQIIRTAIAGELLGFKTIYLEAGSGAINAIDKDVISAVRNKISIPMIVGGGITSTEQIISALSAGADTIVIGNHFEKNIESMSQFVECVHNF